MRIAGWAMHDAAETRRKNSGARIQAEFLRLFYGCEARLIGEPTENHSVLGKLPAHRAS
jgi:hypothetical protein